MFLEKPNISLGLKLDRGGRGLTAPKRLNKTLKLLIVTSSWGKLKEILHREMTQQPRGVLLRIFGGAVVRLGFSNSDSISDQDMQSRLGL